MLTVIMVKPQHTPKPRIQWMLASSKDVPITACEQENDAKILIICPLLELSISNFLFASFAEWTSGLVILFTVPVSCVLLL